MRERRACGACDAGCGSPVDRALLARVDLLALARAEQERFHVFGQELARLWIHQIQAVVIDQHHLLPSPLTPAYCADLTLHALADRPREWRVLKSRARVPAAGAGCVGHELLS